MMHINLIDIAILYIWGVCYPCITNEIDKGEAIHLPKNADFTKKRGILWN